MDIPLLINISAPVFVGIAVQSTRLKKYIDAGGKLILMPAENALAGSFQRIVNDLGIMGNVESRGKLSEFKNYQSFGKIDFQHPVFYDIFEDETKKQIDSPYIYFYLKIKASSIGKPIIQLSDKSYFLSEYSEGNGRLIMFNTAPVLSWSNFPVKGIFAPLLNRIVFYLVSEVKKPKEVIAGGNIIISLGDIALQQITVVKPENKEEILTIDSLNNRSSYKYGKTDNSGIYKFLSREKLFDFCAVNFDPQESNLKYEEEDGIENYLNEIGFKGFYYFIEVGDDYNSIIYQARFGTELWRLFLILALLLALIEMTVAKNNKKDIAEIK